MAKVQVMAHMDLLHTVVRRAGHKGGHRLRVQHRELQAAAVGGGGAARPRQGQVQAADRRGGTAQAARRQGQGTSQSHQVFFIFRLLWVKFYLVFN